MTTPLGPGELTKGIHWSSRCRLFELCPCRTLQPPGGETSHVDPVQLLLPMSKLAKMDRIHVRARITLRELGDDGVVVFGHSPFYKTYPKFRRERFSSDEE